MIGHRHFLAGIAAAAMSTAGATTSQATPPHGRSIDYDYAARDVGKAEWGWHGRAYLHPEISLAPDRPRPLVVFLHGVNPSSARYYWVGGGEVPDVRSWIDELVEGAKIEAPVFAAPTTNESCTLPQALFTGFDLDRFIERTVRATRGQAEIDLERVVVVGHSGAGCNLRGGLINALRGSIAPRAALVVDVCMHPIEGPGFAMARPETDIVVTWQATWKRDAHAFERQFLAASVKRGARGMRVVLEMPAVGPNPHAAILRQSLAEWLPRWLPPNASVTGASP